MNFSIPKLTFALTQSNDPQSLNTALQILLVLTILSLAPSIIIMVTSFTRIIIVLGFIRNALGTQQTPPTQILVGIALFLTFFIMSPIFDKINREAIQPYTQGKISQQDALQKGLDPLREFMFKQTRKKDLLLFVKFANIKPMNKADIPTHVLIISFILSELKTAFQMGFVLFIPFLIVDIAVATILMSMGMMMLPPIMISLPFKILLFILVDGWNLVAASLLLSYK
ncbi:MAG: flagellar type III secretion system pore protein FliP [Candidatus Margulisbacteria bacterium]|nr:flagellar type III secretion system pore protein FliP [Candidatus Margulisiibacteriota bacterium]